MTSFTFQQFIEPNQYLSCPHADIISYPHILIIFILYSFNLTFYSFAVVSYVFIFTHFRVSSFPHPHILTSVCPHTHLSSCPLSLSHFVFISTLLHMILVSYYLSITISSPTSLCPLSSSPFVNASPFSCSHEV
jgi:hypothetical protein